MINSIHIIIDSLLIQFTDQSYLNGFYKFINKYVNLEVDSFVLFLDHYLY
jgi:hypothetical protein